MLREEDKIEIRKRMEVMTNPVELVYFTQMISAECPYCIETEQLLKEVSGLSDKITLKVKNFVTDKEETVDSGIDKIPATVIRGDKDYGMRFYGIPTGYEFASLLEMILHVSSRESGLDENLKKEVQAIDKPVHIQVFVTPTCPYCPKAAITAQQIAMENDLVKADVVEVSEFPQMAQKYGVMGVPKVVINESHGFEGALPESVFMEHIKNALNSG
jgi:glutaredoxin-like protein